VTTFFEQARTKTALWGEPLRHVQRLVSTWQMLADLSFSDLLLLAPVAGDDEHRSVVLGQVRPTTGQTVYPTDLVGTVVDNHARPLVARAFSTGVVVEEDEALIGTGEIAHVQCIPVRHAGGVAAVVSRETGIIDRWDPERVLQIMLEADVGAGTGASVFLASILDHPAFTPEHAQRIHRVGLGGAQARFGITPDLSIFGKVIGGGLPLAAVGGRADVMDELAPLGPVYQAGTLSGNPLAMAAGKAMLDALTPAVYATQRATERSTVPRILKLGATQGGGTPLWLQLNVRSAGG